MKSRQGGGRGPKYGKNVDANQLEIVKALEAIGADVMEIGWPVDLLVGYRERCYLLEVKDPSKPPSARGLSDFQKVFFLEWRGQVDKIETAEEAIERITRAD